MRASASPAAGWVLGPMPTCAYDRHGGMLRAVRTAQRMSTVLIADDHDGFRAALVALVNDADDLRVIAAATGGEEAAALAAALAPDVVVVDLVMPGVDGVEATRRIRGLCPPPAVVALSASRALMRDAIRAGAAFTLLKEAEPADLLEVIRQAARG